MDITRYNQTLTDCFVRYFQSVQIGSTDVELKLRIQGFIQAGEALAIINKERANDIMEQAHFSVFGLTIVQRQDKKSAFKKALKERDENYFELPAYERMNQQ